MNTFVALDFETATGYRDSACAVALVTYTDGVPTDSFQALLRPPRNFYWPQFSELHGIGPQDTLQARRFGQLWPALRRRLAGRAIVAHNARFDRSVLEACLQRLGLPPEQALPPETRWHCTCELARARGIQPAGLSHCCQLLGIPLQHHDALSDARACAQLWLRWGAEAVGGQKSL